MPSSTSSPPTSPGSAARGPDCRRRYPAERRSSTPRNRDRSNIPGRRRAWSPGRSTDRPRCRRIRTPILARPSARWIIAPENPYFTRVIVNRVWADIMGRGIVDPVDDLRATNPPSNGALLDAMADDFRRHGYDLKHLIRTILASSVYALSSEPNDRNVADTRNFSRHYRQRLRAEVLLDAISDVTGSARLLRRRPARLARRGDLDTSSSLAVPRHVRPARPEPGSALRAHQRHLGRPGAPPDELGGVAQEGHQRRRASRDGCPEGRNRRAPSSRNSICSHITGSLPKTSGPSESRSSKAPRPTAAWRSKTSCGHCSTRRNSSSKIDRVYRTRRSWPSCSSRQRGSHHE